MTYPRSTPINLLPYVLALVLVIGVVHAQERYYLYTDQPNQTTDDLTFDRIILLNGTQAELDAKNAGIYPMETGELAITTDTHSLLFRLSGTNYWTPTTSEGVVEGPIAAAVTSLHSGTNTNVVLQPTGSAQNFWILGSGTNANVTIGNGADGDMYLSVSKNAFSAGIGDSFMILGLSGSNMLFHMMDENWMLSIDVFDRQLWSATGEQALDWESRVLYDAYSGLSVDWQTRALYDQGFLPSLDWASRYLADTNSLPALDWGARALYDANSLSALDWANRSLYDTSTDKSLDWEDRTLNGNWSASNLTLTGTTTITSSTVTSGTFSTAVGNQGPRLLGLNGSFTNVFPYYGSDGVPTVSTITSQGRNLLDDTSFSAMRTTLELGNSATLNVGTGTNTVAAGNDSRITGALQATSGTGTGLTLNGTTAAATLTISGNTTIGDASGDALTINAGAVTAPNATSTASGNNLINLTTQDARFLAISATASTLDIVTGTAANKYVTPASLQGATLSLAGLAVESLVVTGNTPQTLGMDVVESAATLDLSTWEGNVVQITGTTAITNMTGLSGLVGTTFRIFSTDATGVVITHGNNIHCPADTNITLSGVEDATVLVISGSQAIVSQ